jgi:hypothetical protein
MRKATHGIEIAGHFIDIATMRMANAMKTTLYRTAFLALVAIPVFSQVFRVDPTPVMTTAGVPPNGYPLLYAVPGASIKLCSDAACATVGRSYTNANGNVQCPVNAPVTWPGTSVCSAVSGPQGQFGFWLASGTYYYQVGMPNGTILGPYPVTPNLQIAGVSGLVTSGPGIGLSGNTGYITITNTGVTTFNGRTGAVTLQPSDWPAGGATTDVQVNTGGVFSGSANLTWNGSILGIVGGINSGQITTSANSYAGVTSTTDGAALPGFTTAQNGAVTAGGYLHLSPITYNPYGGGACTDVYGNPVNQPNILPGDTFGENDAVLWVSKSPVMPGGGSCGAPLPISGGYGEPYGLNTNDYIFARGGFATDNPAWNAFWALPPAGSGANATGGGGMAAASFEAVNYVQTGHSSGVPPLTLNDGFHQGAMNWDDSRLCEQVYNGISWVCLGSGGGGGSTTPGGPSSAVQFNSGGTFGGVAALEWINANSQLIITTPTSATAGAAVANGFMQADSGFLATPSKCTSYNCLQAPGGGSAALSFTASKYIQLGNGASAPTATFGDTFHAGAMYYNTGSGLQVFNGLGWVGVSGGSGSPGGPTTAIQYNSGGSLAGVAALEWNNTNGTVDITAASNLVAGLAIVNGFAQADSGFLATTSCTAYNCLQAPSGGGHALSWTSSKYVQVGNGASAPYPTFGDTLNAGALYYNTSGAGCLEVYNGSTWDCLSGGSGTPGGANTDVQINSSGTLGGSAALTWSGSLLAVTGISSTAGIAVTNAYIQADGGFYVSNSVQYNSVHTQPTGGMAAQSFTATKYVQTGNNNGTPTVTASDSFQAGAMYYNSGSTGGGPCEELFNGVGWSCINGGSTSPGGSNQAVQFNNSGAFGGNTDLTWNGNYLTVNGYVNAANGFASTAPAGSTLIFQDTNGQYEVDASGDVTQWGYLFLRGTSGVDVEDCVSYNCIQAAAGGIYGAGGVTTGGHLNGNGSAPTASVFSGTGSVSLTSGSNDFSGELQSIGMVAVARLTFSSLYATGVSCLCSNGPTACYMSSTAASSTSSVLLAINGSGSYTTYTQYTCTGM